MKLVALYQRLVEQGKPNEYAIRKLLLHGRLKFRGENGAWPLYREPGNGNLSPPIESHCGSAEIQAITELLNCFGTNA